MAASTTLPSGVVERYHYPLLDACQEPTCDRRHATLAELDTFADDDRARDFDLGKEHR